MLDTGVWPEHPSFSDPDPRGKSYPPPPTTPAQCDLGAFLCRFKLIGAYRFMASYDQCVTISGIAPRAHVVVYKVCGRDGCFGSDSVAAIQRRLRRRRMRGRLRRDDGQAVSESNENNNLGVFGPITID